MNERPANPQPSTKDLLSKLSRYEALFELTEAINAAGDIESAAGVLARRLKYVADVYSWRYVYFDGDPEGTDGPEPKVIVVDAHRGEADVTRGAPSVLSRVELDLWRDRRTCILSGDALNDALQVFPPQLHKSDIEQISVNAVVENGKTKALFLFCRRRQPFTDLDSKCLAMVCGFFHPKVHMLWEQQKLRDLELAYLEQEVVLRQSEKLATLGRLSAGMAHELNNPASVARQGAEQLPSSVAGLEHAQFALGAAGLSSEQRDLVGRLEKEAGERAQKAGSLSPVARSDLEQEVEEWLEGIGVEDPWEHASTLVTMGLGPVELDDLTKSLDPSVAAGVIDYYSTKFMTYTLIKEIGHGARRISEIVKALKGYSFMDQGPIQAVDVREGLNDTLVMFSGRLREGVEVSLTFAEDLPRIQGYGGELNQVWTNLIDNAIAAMNGKGALELRAYRDGEWVVVEVADNGPGIPIEVQDKIFDPFFTTKAPGEGTGLGLNISHGIIVEKHRGQISVDSKPGSTRFTVRLPIGNEPSTKVDDARSKSS